jgi:hypothetical protein
MAAQALRAMPAVPMIPHRARDRAGIGDHGEFRPGRVPASQDPSQVVGQPQQPVRADPPYVGEDEAQGGDLGPLRGQPGGHQQAGRQPPRAADREFCGAGPGAGGH